LFFSRVFGFLKMGVGEKKFYFIFFEPFMREEKSFRYLGMQQIIDLKKQKKKNFSNDV